MIDSLAASLIAAYRRCTWIDAFMIDTRFVEETFRVYGAFGPTGRRTANIIVNACTNGTTIVLFTIRVRPTRWWMTYMNFWLWNCGVVATSKQTNKQKQLSKCGQTTNWSKTKAFEAKKHTLWNFITTNGRISGISTQATAIRCMICNETFGVSAANANTWIDTFHIYAGLSHWTIAIHDTFRATFNVRIAIIFGQTSTRAGIVFLFTNCVYSARIRLTSSNFWLMIDYKNKSTDEN